MDCSLIMTVLGPDRPGLVRSLADAVARHGGNWQESRMARMAGQFAGIVRITCAAERVDQLLAEFQDPGIPGLIVQAVRENARATLPRHSVIVEVVGHDRPGIVQELAAAIVAAGGNVEELTTGLESAPMSGHVQFHARGVISLPDHVKSEVLIQAIESLGNDLTVDLSL